jgi:hypothetical protein
MTQPHDQDRQAIFAFLEKMTREADLSLAAELKQWARELQESAEELRRHGHHT